MFKYQILIEYVGTNFRGWQIQKKGKTIQGLIQEKISKILGKKIIGITCNNSLRKALFIIGLIYIYLLTICTLGAGTEQERYLYTGFVINILFMIIIIIINRIIELICSIISVIYAFFC